MTAAPAAAACCKHQPQAACCPLVYKLLPECCVTVHKSLLSPILAMMPAQGLTCHRYSKAGR
jgi:hypothetical protein